MTIPRFMPALLIGMSPLIIAVPDTTVMAGAAGARRRKGCNHEDGVAMRFIGILFLLFLLLVCGSFAASADRFKGGRVDGYDKIDLMSHALCKGNGYDGYSSGSITNGLIFDSGTMFKFY